MKKDNLYFFSIVFCTILIVISPTLVIFQRFGGGVVVSSLDEMAYVLLLLIASFYCALNPFKNYLKILFSIIVLYQFFLALRNQAGIQGVIQIFLNVKLFIAFFAAAFLMRADKIRFFRFLLYFLLFLNILSLVFSIFQVLFPDAYYRLYDTVRHDRGLLGVTLSSFFYSRVAFAQFLVLSILIFLYFQDTKDKFKYQLNKFVSMLLSSKILISLLLLVLFFTSSRKELVFGFVLIPLIRASYGNNKLRNLVLITPVVLMFFVIFLMSFLDASMDEFSEKYTRLQIFMFSVDIFVDYFPFGTGPGTFGSYMSLVNPWLYVEYNIPDSIVYGLGYDSTGRGPIYDLFLITTVVEMGVGFLLIVLFFKRILLEKAEVGLENCKRKMFLFSMVAFLFYSAIFTPAFNTMTGALIMFVAGLMVDLRVFKK